MQGTTKTAPASNGSARYFVDGLVDLGLDYVFANFGTDHVSLIEELARRERVGSPHPEIVLCPHENVAVHMAAGYAAVTGRGQAVMVHVDAGTANSAMGMHNMFRARLPCMLIAGKAPFTMRGELPASRDNYVHFVQDPFDIASLVRPYVKWEYSLHSGVVAKEVLRRGHSVMQSDPPGPVYLTLPREVLAESWDETRIRGFPESGYGPVALGGVEPSRAQAIARRLLEARHPIAVTSYLGRRPEAVEALVELAEFAGLRVYDFSPSQMNFPRDSTCFAGLDAGMGQREADVGLLLDVDVPWLPRFVQENSGTHWTHIDVDPIKKDFPMWGFATHERVQADCATVLRQVLDILRSTADAGFYDRVRERRLVIEAESAARGVRIRRAASEPGKVGAISPAYACAVLGRMMAPEDVLVNEAVRNMPAVWDQIPRSLPRTFIGAAGGGLGYSGGMALGAKLAVGKARVVQVIGDGGFHFSTPSSVYAVAQRYRLPILTVLLDNGGWQAVKEAVLRVYPDGEAARADEFQARLQGEQRNFEQIAQAFGAYGEQVSDPAEVEPAMKRAFAAMDAGRAAVLNIQIGKQ